MNFRNVVRQPKRGITGVHHNAKRKIYHCGIVDKDKNRYQKSFKDFFEACCWRKSMEHQLGYVQFDDVQKEDYRKQKKAEKDRRDYEKHREKRLVKQKNYRENNKDKQKAYRQLPHVKEKKKEHDKKYRAKNLAFLNQYSREYHAKNKDLINKNQREKYASDPEYRHYRTEASRERLEKNRDMINARRRELRHLNPEKIREQKKLWCKNNVLKTKEYARRSYLKHKEARNLRMKIYTAENRQERREYYKKWKALQNEINPQYKAKMIFSARIRSAIKAAGGLKSYKTMDLIGCSVEYLILHIESQFESWMNWDNWGLYEPDGPRTWHIDHIIPLSHFDLTTDEGQKKAFNWTNCRPLCSRENILKSNKLL